MNYKNFIAITNRHLCKENDYLSQIQRIAQLHPKAMVLREKDLPLEEYLSLAKKVLPICKKEGVMLILHNYVQAANALHYPYIHLPLPVINNIFTPNKNCSNLQSTTTTKKVCDNKDDSNLQSTITTKKACDNLKNISILGTSVHSVEDALLAEQLGCTYLFAGNIYETTCKPGLAGKGLSFLKSIVNSVHIPVYAIGGISFDNINEIIDTGAAGGCMMSGFMKY